MADCECLQGCPFYNDKMDSEQGLGALYKKKYCLDDNSNCARYMVFQKLGREKVPARLYPNDIDQARKVIAGA